MIGMVHCLPLPGTYKSEYGINEIIERAVSDAKCLEGCGYDAILVENEDLSVKPHMTKLQLAGFSMVALAVKNAVSIPIGLCCGCLNYEEALSIAKVIGADFIRCPIFVDTVMNYNGIITPCSAEVIAYRNQVCAQNVKIFADLQVKHYHMVNPGIDITESARWAIRQGADAVIVTGSSTGVETSIDELSRVKKSVSVPVAVGSGINLTNITEQLNVADVLIIGTAIKKNGKISEPVDHEKAIQLILAAKIR